MQYHKIKGIMKRRGKGFSTSRFELHRNNKISPKQTSNYWSSCDFRDCFLKVYTSCNCTKKQTLNDIIWFERLNILHQLQQFLPCRLCFTGNLLRLGKYIKISCVFNSRTKFGVVILVKQFMQVKVSPWTFLSNMSQ